MTRYSCEAPLYVILTVVKDRQGSILGFLFREKGHKIMCDCSAAQSAVCCKSLAAAPDFSKRPPC